MNDCIFCRILAGEIPSKKLYEDEQCLAFYDIQPLAPQHFLVIPKAHIASAAELGEEQAALVGHIFAVIAKLTKELGLCRRLPCRDELRRGRRSDRKAPAFPCARRQDAWVLQLIRDQNTSPGAGNSPPRFFRRKGGRTMRILAMFSAAFAAAAALCAYALPAAWCWLPGLCLAALAAALLLLHGDPVRRVRTIALGLAAGFLWCWADAGRLVSVRALCGEGQTIEAEVCSLPERTQYGYRCVALLQGNRMQLYLRNAPEDAALGDRVRVTADVTETGNSLYLASNDILLLGFARGEAEWEHPEQVSLRYAPQRALLAVQRSLTNCFPADAAPLANALVTGDTSGLPYALQTAMSDAGISHIVAVSGMHVTLLLGVVRLLCLRRRRLTAGVGITVMVFFAAMLGFRPSVTRAVVMNAVLLLAPLLGRENDGPTSLCFALLLLLLPNPRAIANVGLQLSFAAVAGLQLFSGDLNGWLQGRLHIAALRERHPLPATAAARNFGLACRRHSAH